MVRRRISYIVAIVALALLAEACNKGLSDADIQKIGDAVAKQLATKSGPPKKAGKVGGSTGDDDAPITMSGGSLTITLWGNHLDDGFLIDSETAKFSHPDLTTRIARQVEYWSGNQAPAFLKKNTEPWSINVNY